MILGKVVGKAVSSAKHLSLNGSKLLVVDPIGAASDDPVLCLDHLGARAGDIVVLSNDGLYAREMVSDETSPARWWVMGIIDDPTKVLEQTQ